VLITGYLPPAATTGRLAAAAARAAAAGESESAPAAAAAAGGAESDPLAAVEAAAASAPLAEDDSTDVRFYKSWDRNGALSNFSPHAIAMPRVFDRPRAQVVDWPTVRRCRFTPD
jgi:diaminohydroxyphosphoribosylaminopyrimidine deaminase/5-amino-6-(5-phosphoribosylamino)uracil reductase